MQILKLIAIVSTASWLLAMAAPALAQGGPVPVVVSIASERLLAPVTPYPGTVISRNHARLAAEVEGRLEWVAEVGVVVRKGETVARLDDVLLKHSLLADKAAVERERARLEYQTAEVRRLTPLVRKRSVPQSQLDEAVANSGMTRAEIAAGKARVALARGAPGARAGTCTLRRRHHRAAAAGRGMGGERRRRGAAGGYVVP